MMINQIKTALRHEYEDPIGASQFSIYFINYLLIEKIGPRAGCLGTLGIMILTSLTIPGAIPLA
jgi:hypothetical protein